MVSAQAGTRRDEAGQSPIVKRCAFLPLKACHELPFLFIIRSLRDCGSSRFTRPSLNILRLRGHRSTSFNLDSDRFCLTAKNQTIDDDTNWKKKDYHVPSSQCSSDPCRFVALRYVILKFLRVNLFLKGYELANSFLLFRVHNCASYK